ncbi:MAG: glycoside hydrolase family 2 TIM barrel-domain containing protein [Chitinophagaceae bacterium]
MYKENKTGYLPLIFGLIFLAVFSSCKAQQGFVKVSKANFVINKKPYYFVGTNFWYGAYLGAEAAYGNIDRLIRELDQLEKLGIKNLRIAAASEESDFALPLSPPFQYKNGAYNETLFEGLDFLLAEMGKRNMRAVLFLNNFWDWTGGMSQYVSWIENQPVIDPSANKNETWNEAINFSSRFYKLTAAQNLYRKYISHLVNRLNIYTKKAYKNDPAIMAWELANEPRPVKEGNEAENVKDFSSWVNETAAYIHSLDKNHLITTGSEGSKGTLNSLDYAMQVHQSKYIDYITFHLWPKNWGWYKASNPETMVKTKENTNQYIAEHLSIATKLNKPIVLEEFGFVRDGETYSPDSAVTARNDFFKFVLNLFQDSIKAKSPFSGVNFWGWGGEGRAQQNDYRWKPGDTSYVADPYSEHQGLNSVYDTDKSTQEMITEYAREIEKLSSAKKSKR